MCLPKRHFLSKSEWKCSQEGRFVFVNCSWDQVINFSGAEFLSFAPSFYTASTFYDLFSKLLFVRFAKPHKENQRDIRLIANSAAKSQGALQKHCSVFFFVFRDNQDSLLVKFSPLSIFRQFLVKDESEYQPSSHNTQMMKRDFGQLVFFFLVPKKTVILNVHNLTPILFSYSPSLSKGVFCKEFLPRLMLTTFFKLHLNFSFIRNVRSEKILLFATTVVGNLEVLTWRRNFQMRKLSLYVYSKLPFHFCLRAQNFFLVSCCCLGKTLVFFLSRFPE